MLTLLTYLLTFCFNLREIITYVWGVQYYKYVIINQYTKEFLFFKFCGWLCFKRTKSVVDKCVIFALWVIYENVEWTCSLNSFMVCLKLCGCWMVRLRTARRPRRSWSASKPTTPTWWAPRGDRTTTARQRRGPGYSPPKRSRRASLK